MDLPVAPAETRIAGITEYEMPYENGQLDLSGNLPRMPNFLMCAEWKMKSGNDQRHRS